ncbi:hypothetical protein K493DRAFT_336619 [Basidiobolus meristosporus CBS 931.73]|uniref:PH domain-containing protein n=1 Tax=Basidiobolus meristosporus CBS 931.73 TaxID=1314790 RepID=A0A1Y1YHS8_9FUNG|nr:hypothetical protein K493DRAFT_336619 [Basidiobolus meristosporus CBS 931.73]|eukprot:ORX97266.1 hypothetical protein K493DRAFT_336619 [Basidiobolus meristosporus CBS 931.73]
MSNKHLAHIATLAMLNGSQSRALYSNEEASLSSPILERESNDIFRSYRKAVKACAAVNAADELGDICNALNTIVAQRKVKSHYTQLPKIGELLESLDACLDKAVSEAESSGPSTPAEFGQDTNDASGPRKFSNASSNSSNSERSELSSLFGWNTDSYSLRSVRESNPVKEVSLSEVYMDAVLAGWLNKLRINNGSFFSRKTWKRRLLVLTPTHLYQFKTSAAQSKSVNAFEISTSTTINICEKYPEKRWVLEIQGNSQHPWHIQAESMEDLKTWLNSLRATVVRAKYAIRTLPEVPMGNVYKEMVRRTSANNVQAARPRVPRPSKSMSHAPTASMVQSTRYTKDEHTSGGQTRSNKQTKPRIDINISHSPFFDNSLLASLSSSPTRTAFPATVSKKPCSTLPTVLEC